MGFGGPITATHLLVAKGVRKAGEVLVRSLPIVEQVCSPTQSALDFLEFYKTQGTIGFPVRIALLINIPKGFSSKMTLEVAKIGLKVSTQYML